jgi:hypothetical protein
MIKINRENIFGSLLNNLSQIFNPPEEPKLRGYCSKLGDRSIINASIPDIVSDPETQILHCRCQESGNCKKESGVVASAIKPKF